MSNLEGKQPVMDMIDSNHKKNVDLGVFQPQYTHKDISEGDLAVVAHWSNLERFSIKQVRNKTNMFREIHKKEDIVFVDLLVGTAIKMALDEAANGKSEFRLSLNKVTIP